MTEFLYRTEDIRTEEILKYYVETNVDRSIVNALKTNQPVVVVGSRGVGKSFLLRVAEAELLSNLKEQHALPVYVSFMSGTLLHTSDPEQFQHWMLARLCISVLRTLRKQGLVTDTFSSLSILSGSTESTVDENNGRIVEIMREFEGSWKNPGREIDLTGLPGVDEFKNIIEDICENLGLRRFVVFFDEAAHIFRPQQQRQFFTLFRDLRSPYLTCNAAVYPGVTAFGDTFQPMHDATMLVLDRDVVSDKYSENMREIVEKQADSNLLAKIAQNGQNFAVLAYAATGNPRQLLKTLTGAPKLNKREVNEVIREYYRTDIWAEHSGLVDRYGGHRNLIDWGRFFIEEFVLPGLQQKNTQYLSEDKKSTCFFWVHRDTPEPVKEALRILAYTGIIVEHSTGIKASRAEIGTRYAINLGCLFSQESVPSSSGFQIAKNLTPRRMTEYGANHKAYEELLKSVPKYSEPDMSEVLQRQLMKHIEVLDIRNWQKERPHGLELNTIGDILQSSETKLQDAYYVGPKRSRRIKNAALAAVFEYLSG